MFFKKATKAEKGRVKGVSALVEAMGTGEPPCQEEGRSSPGRGVSACEGLGSGERPLWARRTRGQQSGSPGHSGRIDKHTGP